MKARIAQLVKRLRQSRARRIEAKHILGIACTGHGASLAYLGRDGTVRCSVLDRWAGIKNVLMLAQSEEQDIRYRDDASGPWITYQVKPDEKARARDWFE